jgi:ribose transport system ATP-binding protein
MNINPPNIVPLLRMTDVRKSFPGVQAISRASLELYPGEIHALVGENGAGKSTLIKILTGAHRADAGEVWLGNKQVTFSSPQDASRAGITAIYQEFSLIPALPVYANIFLGRENTRHGLINPSREKKNAVSLLEKLDLKIDPETAISELSIAHQQLVEIVKALAGASQILIMDEPTAALAPHEVEILFGILRDLKAQGIGIVFIGHRLEEIFEIADRVTVMRDGTTLGTWNINEISKAELIARMVGRSIEDEFPKLKKAIGETYFEVKILSGGRVKNVSLSAKRGEVLGIAGLMGAGRTEVARLIFGADSKEGGQIIIDGQNCDIRSPRNAIDRGICLLTEDRKAQGLVLMASCRENFALPNLLSWSRLGFVDGKLELERFSKQAQALNIRLSSPEQRVEDLSGGNQQKLLVARWLETNFEIIIFDEPTRGIDVGAKHEMYLLINELAARGKVVIVISSDLLEILGISNRIIVMREGRIAGEINDVPNATQEEIMALAT